jgi:hypothetical protein
LEKLKGKDHFGDVGVHVKVILKRILKKYALWLSIGLKWLMMFPLADFSEHANKYLGIS